MGPGGLGFLKFGTTSSSAPAISNALPSPKSQITRSVSLSSRTPNS